MHCVCVNHDLNIEIHVCYMSKSTTELSKSKLKQGEIRFAIQRGVCMGNADFDFNFRVDFDNSVVDFDS